MLSTESENQLRELREFMAEENAEQVQAAEDQVRQSAGRRHQVLLTAVLLLSMALATASTLLLTANSRLNSIATTIDGVVLTDAERDHIRGLRITRAKLDIQSSDNARRMSEISIRLKEEDPRNGPAHFTTRNF